MKNKEVISLLGAYRESIKHINKLLCGTVFEERLAMFNLGSFHENLRLKQMELEDDEEEEE